MALATFQSMQNDLALVGMARLLNADFGALLNRANAEETDAYDWSWILSTEVIYSAAPYSTGTVTIAQGGATVNGQGTNWTGAFNLYQFRAGPSGMLIPISGINGPTTLTLAQPWNAPSLIQSTYSLAQNYYQIPNAKEVTAVRQIFPLEQVSRNYLNIADPQRLSIGGNPSTAWAIAPPLSGVLQIELWPVPSAAVPYVVEFNQTAVTMVNPTDVPQIPFQVLEAKAMWYAAQALYASSGDAKWGALAKTWQGVYESEKEKAQYADKLRKLTKSPRDPQPTFGMDIIPTHDTSTWPTG